jgi:hypothetical protein
VRVICIKFVNLGLFTLATLQIHAGFERGCGSLCEGNCPCRVRKCGATDAGKCGKLKVGDVTVSAECMLLFTCFGAKQKVLRKCKKKVPTKKCQSEEQDSFCKHA